MSEENISSLTKNKKWKNKNSKYLFELQKFIDIVDNVENVKLRKKIIEQMLKCDKCITDMAEQIFNIILEEK